MSDKDIKYTINFQRIAIGWLLESWLLEAQCKHLSRYGFCKSFRKEILGGKSRSNLLVTWAKWSSDTMITISFQPCLSITHALPPTISSSYIIRQIINVDNINNDMNNYFQCTPDHLLTSFHLLSISNFGADFFSTFISVA